MLKSTRIGTGKIKYNESSIELAATLSNMEKAGAEMGCEGLEAIRILASDEKPTNLAKLFHYLQVGTDYSADTIYEWLFGDLQRFQENTEEVQTQIARAIPAMMGLKFHEQFPTTADPQKKDGE